MILLSWVWLENFERIRNCAGLVMQPVAPIHDTEGTLLISEDNLDGLTQGSLKVGRSQPQPPTIFK